MHNVGQKLTRELANLSLLTLAWNADSEMHTLLLFTEHRQYAARVLLRAPVKFIAFSLKR